MVEQNYPLSEKSDSSVYTLLVCLLLSYVSQDASPQPSEIVQMYSIPGVFIFRRKASNKTRNFFFSFQWRKKWVYYS